MSQSIKFAHNYNNKLMCVSFTTIRLRDDAKFKVGDYYDIYYQWKNPDQKFIEVENFLGPARLLEVRHFKLNELNVYMSHIDMGLHQFEGKKELIRLYGPAGINWETQQLSYLLLEMDETQIRYIIPDRIKRARREANLFTGIPHGYEAVPQ